MKPDSSGNKIRGRQEAGVSSDDDKKGVPKTQKSHLKEGSASVSTQGPPAKTENKDKKISRESYEIIAQKNLFSPNRNPFEIMDEEKVEETFDPDAEMMVYGTFIIGTQKSALIKELGPEKQKAKEMTVGATVARYRIKDITQDNVIVEDPKGRTYTLTCARAKKEKRDIRTNVPGTPGGPQPGSGQPKRVNEPPAPVSPPPSGVIRPSQNRQERAAILSELRKKRLQNQTQTPQNDGTK